MKGGEGGKEEENARPSIKPKTSPKQTQKTKTNQKKANSPARKTETLKYIPIEP